MAWVATIVLDTLWRSALAVVPLAVAVWCLSRIFKCNSTTRHAMWTLTLLWLVLPVMLPDSPLSRLENPRLVSNDVSTSSGEAASAAVGQVTLAPVAIESVPAEPVGIASSDERRANRTAKRSARPTLLPREEHQFRLNPLHRIEESPPPRRDSMMAAPGSRFDPVDRLVPPGESAGLPALSRSESPGPFMVVAEIPTPVQATEPSSVRPEVVAAPAVRAAPRPTRHAEKNLSGPLPTVAHPSKTGSDQSHLPVSNPSIKTSPITGYLESCQDHLTAWFAGIAALLAAAASLPRFPSELWLAGALLVLAVYLARLVSSWGAIRNAVPAPDSVNDLVRSMAGRIGLSRVPQTWMTDAAVGPMIRCGRPATLVLPLRLWSQLDRKGRQAVVCHELAHLRRRDHWVRRFELLVAVVYWWHPVVWWVRRQLHQEAELSCDAWVTWIMPGQRRSYAEALLQTKQYVGTANQTRHVGAIGILSGRASQLARRITMVMTGTDRPRLSLRGFALMAALAAAGWMATPARSCPPEKAALAEHSAHAAAGKACAHTCDKKCANQCTHTQCKHCATTASAQATSFERYEAQRAAGALASSEASGNPAGDSGYVVIATDEPGDAPRVVHFGSSSSVQTVQSSGRNRSDHLEQRMDRLEKMLEELLMRNDGKRKPSKKAPKRQRAPRRLRAPRQPAPPAPPFAPVPPSSTDAGSQVTREYRLQDGKLDALTQLMVRSDVPILVRPGAGKITVIATESNQRIFKTFVDLINGSDEELQEDYSLTQGKLDALTTLMLRSDVPVIVSPDDESIILYGNSLQQRAFAAFIDMIDPPRKKAGRGASGTRRDSTEPVLPQFFRFTPDAPESRGRASGVVREAERRERRVERQRDLERRAKDRAERRQKRQRGVRKSRVEHDADSSRVLAAIETERFRELLAKANLAIGADKEAVAEFNALIERGNVAPIRARVDALDVNARVLAEQAAAIELRVGAARDQAAQMRDAAIRMRDDAQRLDAEAEQLRQEAIELDETSQKPASEPSHGELGEMATDLYAEAKLADVEAQTINRHADELDEDALAAREKAEAIAAFVEQLVGYLSTLGT